MTADIWQFWRDALAGKSQDIDADAPQCGFYKRRERKDGPWLPVMIRYDGAGVLRCRVGDNSNADPIAVWVRCAGNPVTKEDAKIAFETGSFPGEVAAIGDNSADLSLAEQIADFAKQALTWFFKSGIKDKKSADMAANYRAELLRLRKQADEKRKEEKRPHLAASRAIDANWKPLIEEAEGAANEIRDGLTRWMREEEKRLLAEQEAERKALEAARVEAIAQYNRNMAEDPIATLTGPAPELPPEPEPVKVQAGGQRGKKTGFREVTRYVVTDYAAALAHVKDHPDVRAAVEKVCAAQAKSGAVVPGVEIRTEKVAA